MSLIVRLLRRARRPRLLAVSASGRKCRRQRAIARVYAGPTSGPDEQTFRDGRGWDRTTAVTAAFMRVCARPPVARGAAGGAAWQHD